MSRYKVTTGQNLYDVALHIYGSIEGVSDLLMSNPSLSLSDKLPSGKRLVYSDDYIINPEVVAYYRNHTIVPSGGERSVYHKTFTMPLILDAYLDSQRTTAGFAIAGSGKLEIDWGDNTLVESVILSDNTTLIEHAFDNAIPVKRKISLYGDIDVKRLDLTQLIAIGIFLLRPLPIERFILSKGKLDIGFIALLDGVFEVDLTDITTESLIPLLSNKGLMRLNISGLDLKPHTIDAYLIGLVKQYYNRRNCFVTLSCQPSGEYREPARDKDMNYNIKSGMEAIWVLTHEPTWNEGGYWRFVINGKNYSTEPIS